MKGWELSGFFFSLSFFFQIRMKTPSVLDGKPDLVLLTAYGDIGPFHASGVTKWRAEISLKCLGHLGSISPLLLYGRARCMRYYTHCTGMAMVWRINFACIVLTQVLPQFNSAARGYTWTRQNGRGRDYLKQVLQLFQKEKSHQGIEVRWIKLRRSRIFLRILTLFICCLWMFWAIPRRWCPVSTFIGITGGPPSEHIAVFSCMSTLLLRRSA